MQTISELTSVHAQSGIVQWIGVRPERRANLIALDAVEITDKGLQGDHYQTGGKRSVSLIQYEHLPVIASVLGRETVHPADLRRNILISGINLLGLRKAQFRIGNAILEGSGICAPCSRMQETLGDGGYNAVRGHGGITATIIQPGSIKIGDALVPL